LIALLTSHKSALHRQRSLPTRRLKQLDLRIPPSGQTRQNISTRPIPLGQLLRRNSVGVLPVVKAPHERRATHVPTTDVERPRDKRAVLVVVEDDGVGDLVGQTLLVALR
jgi:hypothetical protein